MAVVHAAYDSEGFEVHDMHDRESYDFLCEKDGVKTYVEVKGTRGNGSAIVLTGNEVEKARELQHQSDLQSNATLCVVHSIIITSETTTGGVLERYDNWNPDAHELKAISYQCRLKKSGTQA